MKIGLDFDGVIADCGDLKREGALRLFGVDIPVEKFKREIVVNEEILTNNQYTELQKKIYETRELGLLAKIVEGAKEYIELLKSENHTLTIVTSRHKNGLLIAKEWAVSNGIDLPFVGCEGSKESYCRDLELDVFVDDDFDKIESVANVVKYNFLFSWGYNESVGEKPISTRIHSWRELYEKISDLSA